MKRLIALALAALVACGPKTMFRLASEDTDNDRAALAKALDTRKLPEHRAPQNTAQKPRLFVLAAGSPRTIIAYDLETGSALWKVDADVQSRIWVGGDFIIAREGTQLVARDQKTGAVRWKHGIAGAFVGATADGQRAYATWREGNEHRPLWRLTAFDGTSGRELWNHEAQGALGAPVAQGGLVYSPFLTQWLSLIDGKTGTQVARLRGIDEQISMVRATSRIAYFGSKQGVFQLDLRAASGKRADATYGQARIPSQLDRTSYGIDLYDDVQTTYTAADRARVLWSSRESDDGPMKFTADTYAVHYFRYVFGFNATGDLVWAYSHPRVELVASEHTGLAIVGLSSTGELVVIDPKSGAVRARQNLGVANIVGATFDADGWNPHSDGGAKIETVVALVGIARDRDARFDRVKELALSSLAKLPGADVTKELLAVVSDKRVPAKLKDAAIELLAQRKDPASLPVLTAQLATRYDFLGKTEPEALAPVVKAIGGLRGVKLDPAHVTAALAALQVHLEDPATPMPELVLVITAMSAIGNGAERLVLGSHLLLYHADERIGGDPAWQKAITGALASNGGPPQRELLRQVAADPRTEEGLSGAIHEALVNK